MGNNRPQISALHFRAMGLSIGHGTPPSDEDRFKVYNRAIELGSHYFDSADVYGDSDNLLRK